MSKHTSVVDYNVDVLIVGGGLVGSLLMLALANTGLSCLLIDENDMLAKQTAVSFDTRSLALSPASVAVLKMLNIWSKIQDHATQILQIHVSQKGSFGQTRLKKEQQPLGFVIEIPYLSREIAQQLDVNKLLMPAKLVAFDAIENIATINHNGQSRLIKAQIVVGADGSNSRLRALCNLQAEVKSYVSDALVANIELRRSHNYCAYERFTRDGPLALLPLHNQRMSLVWSMQPAHLHKWLHASDAEFLRELQKTFGYRAGRFLYVGRRGSYNLTQVFMPNNVYGQTVFVGNAANTLHPIAGQGFNLGLRDVAMLSQCMIQFGLNANMLDQYKSLRAQDQKYIRCFTNSLMHTFTPNVLGMSMLRGLGLLALDNFPWMKQQIIKMASGFAGTPPDLACGIGYE